MLIIGAFIGGLLIGLFIGFGSRLLGYLILFYFAITLISYFLGII